MTPNTKKIVAGLFLTLTPFIAIQQAKQTSWGKFLVTPSARQEGDAHAPVLMVEYSDFQCPMCAKVQPALRDFLERYKGKVRLAYKYYPLRMHKNAIPAAHAAECAAEQKKFWPYQTRLFETQLQWGPLADATTTYMSLAKEVQLDLDAFKICFADPSKEAPLMRDRQEAEERQITATPTLFIGDERLVGSYIETDGARMIERALRN